MSNTCGGCQRALNDAYLCKACVGKLDAALRELPDLLAELTDTAYRQDRIAVAAERRGDERPVPFRPVAARLLADTRLVLWRWCRPTLVPATDSNVCHHLRERLPELVKSDPNAGLLHAAVLDAVDRIRELIDLPRTHRYLGRCDGCGAELYADREAEVWNCQARDCDRVYDARARIAELLERARDVVAPTSTIATALTSMEHPVTEELIRKWASRGLLTARSNAGRQRAYRLGDVLDLLLRQRSQQACRP